METDGAAAALADSEEPELKAVADSSDSSKEQQSAEPVDGASTPSPRKGRGSQSNDGSNTAGAA